MDCILKIIFLLELGLVGNVSAMNQLLSCSPQEQLAKAIKCHSLSLCKEIINECPYLPYATYDTRYFDDGYSPLHLAVVEDSDKLIPFLYQCSNLVGIRTSVLKNTPFHLVRSVAVAQKLLECGLTIRSKNIQGETPLLHILFDKHKYIKRGLASDSERYAIAHYLFQYDNQLIDESVDAAGNRLLHKAIEEGDSLKINFLLEHGAQLEIYNKQGLTPLDIALKKRRMDLLETKEARIFFRYNDYKYNPIKLLKNNAKYLKELVIDPTKNEVVPLRILAKLFMFLSQSQLDAHSGVAVIGDKRKGYCFKNASFQHLQQIVEDASIEYAHECLKEKCFRALCYAQNNEMQDILEWIQDYPFVVSYDKDMAFELFDSLIEYKNVTVFEKLLLYNPDLNHQNRYGHTILHRAVLFEDVQAVEILVKHGVDLTIRDICGKTALDLAHMLENKKCIAVLHRSFFEKLFATPSYKKEFVFLMRFLKDDAEVRFINPVHLCDIKKRVFLETHLK